MVENNFEELNAKIQKHRRKIFLRGAGIVVAVVMGVALLELWTALRSFDSFEIRNTVKREQHCIAIPGFWYKYRTIQ